MLRCKSTPFLIASLNLSKDDIPKYLRDLQKKIPKKRKVGIIKQLQSNKIKVFLSDSKIITVNFKNASWARPQTIKKDKKNKLNIFLGKKFKSFKDFLNVGDIIVLKENSDNKEIKTFSLSQIPLVNGAIVALDPHTGRVLAMSGGYSFENSEFNRATQAKRQPGSAFKPFVYLASLEKSYAPTDLIYDAPLAYPQCDGCPKWKPANYTKKFYGLSPLRLGIEKSRNLMTARLAIKLIEEEKLSIIQEFAFKHKIDEDKLHSFLEKKYSSNTISKHLNINVEVIESFFKNLNKQNIIQRYAKLFGINQTLPPYLSMSLGAGETTLLDLTNAYGMIVNGGKKITATLIDRVQNRRGVTIFKHDQRDCIDCKGVTSNSNRIPSVATLDSREKIISSASAYQMTSMLKGAVDRGTGIIIKTLKRNLAGKTGTTNSNADAWFVGFSSDLVVGVFVGFDKPRPLGYKETGSSVAAPIFRDFMKATLKNIPDIPFRRPSGIKLISVNSKTGMQVDSKNKNSILESFKPGQLPNLMYKQRFFDFQNSKKAIKNLSPLY